MTTRTSAVATGCVGEGCNTPTSWPLHHVRHRGVFRRLCTSCVLKCFPGSFCALCFAILDGSYLSPSELGAGSRPAVVHCSGCPSVSHLACLTNPGVPVQFVCPICNNPDGFSFFPVCTGCGEERQRPAIDVDSAKALLAAARLAVASMCNAAAAAKVEAERKMLEAVAARKKAKDLLERAILISKKERKRKRKMKKKKKKPNGSDAKVLALMPEATNRDKKKKPNGSDTKALALMPEATNQDKKKKKKKKPKLNGAAGGSAEVVPKRTNTKEMEKKMRFHERKPAAHLPAQTTVTDAKSKGTSVANVQGNVAVENKDPPSTKLLNLPKNPAQITVTDAKSKGISVANVQRNVAVENKDPSSTKLNLLKNVEHQYKERKEFLFNPQTQSSTRRVSQDASISRSDQKAQPSNLPK